MRTEHCHGPLAHRAFTTINYRISTCPAREWAIVVDGAECGAEEMGYKRRKPEIGASLALPLSEAAGLKRPEVIAVVLYSGPMVSGRPGRVDVNGWLEGKAVFCPTPYFEGNVDA